MAAGSRVSERLRLAARAAGEQGRVADAQALREAAASWALWHARMWAPQTSRDQRQAMLPEVNRAYARALLRLHAETGEPYCGGAQT